MSVLLYSRVCLILQRTFQCIYTDWTVCHLKSMWKSLMQWRHMHTANVGCKFFLILCKWTGLVDAETRSQALLQISEYMQIEILFRAADMLKELLVSFRLTLAISESECKAFRLWTYATTELTLRVIFTLQTWSVPLVTLSTYSLLGLDLGDIFELSSFISPVCDCHLKNSLESLEENTIKM